MTFSMWINMWFQVTLELDGDINKLNSETIQLSYLCLRLVREMQSIWRNYE